MLAIVLPFLSILGFASFFSRYLKRPLGPLLFTSTAFIGVLQFLFALAGYIAQGSLAVLILGTLFFIYYFFSTRDHRSTIWFYLLIAVFIVLFDVGLQFSSIDDYSFWGVMSKYLFFFHQLPTNADYISASFLTYTPGMACFHYLFYYAIGNYSQLGGYVGQGAVLLSALMVLYDPKNQRQSVFRIAVAYIILNVGFGTLLARMEVDGYVAAYVFAIAWVLYSSVTVYKVKIPLSPVSTNGEITILFFPILFLPLIKEIGLFFGVILSLAYFISHKKSWKHTGLFGLLLIALFGLKWLWLLHCHHYGFASFSRAITLNSALSALNPFNIYFQPAQILVLKSLTLGRFGHVLEWPNLVTYFLLFYMWHSVGAHAQGEQRQHAMQFKWVFVIAIILYAIMLYLLQAITFDVGHSFDHTLDFQRYFNMLLIPFFLFTLLVYTEETNTQQAYSWQKYTMPAVIIIALIFAASGKIERTIRYNRPNPIVQLVALVKQQLPQDTPWVALFDR